jgi:hypothetical protein
MNARNAANHSDTKVSILITEDGYQFRWEAGKGELLMFKGNNPEDTELVGRVSADQADEVLNSEGWKPQEDLSRLEVCFWTACYFIGSRLRLPGFHKGA